MCWVAGLLPSLEVFTLAMNEPVSSGIGFFPTVKGQSKNGVTRVFQNCVNKFAREKTALSVLDKPIAFEREHDRFIIKAKVSQERFCFLLHNLN